jgi:hypothetical protein
MEIKDNLEEMFKGDKLAAIEAVEASAPQAQPVTPEQQGEIDPVIKELFDNLRRLCSKAGPQCVDFLVKADKFNKHTRYSLAQLAFMNGAILGARFVLAEANRELETEAKGA